MNNGPLKISNNVFEIIQSSIQAIDSMALFIMNSPSAKKETVDAVVDGAKNIKKTINVISKSLSDVVKALAELEVNNFNAVIDAGSIFMISSIKMAMSINKGDQFHGPALIIASYAKLIGLISELSTYAKNVDAKAIKKASKATSLVFSYLYRTQRSIARRAILIEKLGVPQLMDSFFETTNGLINKVKETLIVLGGLIQTYNELGGRKIRRQTRRAMGSLFGIYVDTIVGAMQLSELLFTGTLHKSFLIPKKYRSKVYGVSDILKALVSLIAMTGYFNLIFKMMVPITEQLTYIGTNRRYIRRGLRTLWVILYGSSDHDTPGLLDIMTRSRSLTSARIKKLAITGVLLTTFLAFSLLLKPVISTLVTIGSNKVKVVLGLAVLKMMIVDDADAKVKSLTYTFTQAGNPSNIKNLRYAIILVAGMALLMTMMYIVYASLNFAGKNYRNIRRGIRATSLILMGSKGFLGIGKTKSLIQIISSITPKDVEAIEKSFKPIAELTALSILLNILTLNLAIIGRRGRYIRRGVRAIAWINKLINIIADINITITRRKINAKEIWNVSKILILVTGMLAIVAVELTLIGMNVLGIALAIPALLLMRVVLAEIIWLSNYLQRKGKGIAKSSVIFRSVGILLFRIARIFLMFIAASLTLAVIGLATASMLAVIGGLTLTILAILAISLLPMSNIIITSLAMISIAISVYIMSLTFTKISESSENMNFTSLFQFITLTIAMIGMFALIGLASPLMLLAVIGSASMVAVGAALLLLVLPLMLISSLKPEDFENAEVNSTLIIQTSLNIMRQFMNAAGAEINGGKQPQTWVGRILTGTLGTAGALLEAVLSVAFVALTFATVTLLLLTAAELSLLDNITIDQTSIETNVDLVVGTALKVIEAICGRKNPTIEEANGEKKGLFGTLFKGLGDVIRGVRNIADSILSFGFVAVTLLSVGMVALIAKNLEYIEKVKINPEAITAKVDMVINTSNSLISHIRGSKLDKDDIRKARHVKEFMKQIKKTAKYMGDIGEMNNTGQFDRAIDSYVKFVDKVNTVKIENLKTATNMFEKMAEFSKSINGNFEGLAEALEEKIMPLLEELNESLGKTNSTIGEGINVKTATTPGTPVTTTTTTTPNGQTTVNRDYTRSLDQIYQELKKMQIILTDGSQVTLVDSV